MQELRKDPIISRWVIISTKRRQRPSDFVIPKIEHKGGFCPFCEGNEDKTPPEIISYRKSGTLPNSPGWWLRVVPNKFPALMVEGELNSRGAGLYDKMNGVGAHEVIIETPEHIKNLTVISQVHFRDVLWIYRERMLDLQKDIRLQYILIFKNQGMVAGASLEHSHTQLIATPIVPKTVVEELNGAEDYYDYKERCVYCDIIMQERQDQVRLIEENSSFVAISPFASRFPFETWIVPKKHYPNYELMKPDEYDQLASIFQEILQKFMKGLNNPDYNFILHTSPANKKGLNYYHWHIEIIPKLTSVAGFEWGSGFYINPTSPEEAAEFLKAL